MIGPVTARHMRLRRVMKNHQESKKQLEVVQIYLSFHSFKTQFGNESLQKSDEIEEGFTILGILGSSPSGARVPGFGVFEHGKAPSGARVPVFGRFEHENGPFGARGVCTRCVHEAEAGSGGR